MHTGADGPTWRDAWVSALDELELSVERAEQLLAATEPVHAKSVHAELVHAAPVHAAPVHAAPWSPPPVRGAMPEDLVPRARLLHERQLAVAHDIAVAAAATGRQLRVAVRMRETAPPDVPVYLDITG
ncbi:MAG TPA: hypothetical protein VFJ14_09260 [Nocardioidaceae bacterium]|nr:hypothetical protein [Nocardioidaceae bacterium]